MSGSPVSQTEFHAFRSEMRECMQQQTELMRQMVELQTKHNNLESTVRRIQKVSDETLRRLIPLEQAISGASVKSQYNRDLIWVILLFVVGIASWKVRGGM
ncbi:chromosome partitioning protein ParA [Vibrio sp. La 4.2.2]|uniref:chromosome partitioning protein ParA n=1 Tax=Vibrio sp. La 4.2.2 TaxID=2998830 RepID=UPI0022CE2A58|nr:chromosome partitioning protein ParA [Vibrio sp. La 4.2.2]MDA0109011.1 chromosome partitioning protein ParA [Vibrio sp. La 4.2.2]